MTTMSSVLIPAFLQYIGTNRNVRYVPEYDRGVEVTAHSDSCTKLHVDTTLLVCEVYARQ